MDLFQSFLLPLAWPRYFRNATIRNIRFPWRAGSFLGSNPVLGVVGRPIQQLEKSTLNVQRSASNDSPGLF